MPRDDGGYTLRGIPSRCDDNTMERLGNMREKRNAEKKPGGLHRAVPIILTAIAVFLGICFITASDTGLLGSAISGALKGMFSIGAYAIPFIIALHAVLYLSDVEHRRVLPRAMLSLLTILAISMLGYVISNWAVDGVEFNLGHFYEQAQTKLVGGGLFGGLIAYPLSLLIDKIGTLIVIGTIFVVYLIYLFSTGKTLLEIGRVIIYGILTVFAYIERGLKAFFGLFGNKKKRLAKEGERIDEITDDEFFDVDNGLERLEISELGIVESRDVETIESNPTLHEQVYHRSAATTDDEPSRGATATDTGASGRGRVIDMSLGGWNADIEDATVREERYDDIVVEEPQVVEREVVGAAPIIDEALMTDSADSVFARDFDPYSIAVAEEMANKPSSRIDTMATGGVGATITESIDDITVEEYERRKRVEEFERAKRRAMAKREPRPVTNTGEYAGKPKNIEYHVHDTEEIATQPRSSVESVTVTIEKVTDTPSTASDTTFRPYTVPTDTTPRASGLVFEVDDDTDIRDSGSGITIERTPIVEESARFTVTKPEPVITEVVVTEDEDEESAIREIIEGSTTPSVAEAREVVHSITHIIDDEDEEDEIVDEEPEEDDEVVEDIPEGEENPYVVNARNTFDFFRREEETVDTPDEPLTEDTAVDIVEDEDEDDEDENDIDIDDEDDEYEDVEDDLEDEGDSEDEDEDEPPFDVIKPAPTAPKKEPAPKKKDEFKHYKMPPLDLLTLPVMDEEDDEIAKEEMRENIKTIVETLASFNVTASIKGVDRGPRITRYEVVPAKGVRVNQITSLFNDIVLALAVEGVRMEAPIPGKAAIGFEIPNKKFCTVTLRELLETSEYQSSTSTTFVCVGKDVAGTPVFGEIEKYPHALIAGATNMGKSVCINSIILSMLYHARPDELRFILIDPKKVEFKIYSGIPHLLVPVVTEAKQAAGALMWAVDEMERRFDQMEGCNAKNIKEYNALVAKDPSIGEKFAKIIIVIDELNDLMMQVRDPVESLIMRLAQKARAAGIHLIIGTQRPDVKVITGTIKANITARMSCKVTSQVDSRTILETIGAEKLLPYGDILYKPPERTTPLRVQGAFVSTPEVEAVISFIKEQTTGDHYDEEVLAEINKAAQKCGKKGGSQAADDDMDDGDDECGYYSDQQFLDSVEVAIRSGKVSTSLLQRKLKIGFSKAARYVDAMEEIGIVSEPNGQKPRDVLITMDEWYEKLSRVNMD